MLTPRLKPLDCLAAGDTLLVSRDPRTRIELADPTGQVLDLLRLLHEGTRTASELHAAVAERWPAVNRNELDSALDTLDGLGWLENATSPERLNGYERERYASNLAFFDAFTTLRWDRETIQRKLLDARVVVLGAGGLGSSVVQNLAGLGVSHFTLLDFDTVGLRNFARQFTYTEGQLGRPKVEELAAWLRAFNSRVELTVRDARVGSSGEVRAVASGADLVIAAIDRPDAIDLWVNEGCVAAGVPFIRGGLAHMQGVYWSVDPGRSPCRQCLESHRDAALAAADRTLTTGEPVLTSARVNAATGPVAQMLGALVAMEALRYLTGIVAPVSAGTYQLVDFTGDCAISSDPWPADPACAVCASAPTRVAA